MMRYLLFASVTLLLAGRATQAAPEMKAVWAAPAPVVDGRLDDACWREAPAHGEFSLLGKEAKAAQQTRVRAAYDGRALYLAVECDEAEMAKVVAATKKRDGGVYNDDCVEVFLAPGPAPRPYYHFLANPAGTLQDEIGTDTAWNPEWQAKAAKGAAGWLVEIALPFASVPIPAGVGERWRINVTRSEKASGELSCWAPCAAGFHEPDRFGTVALPGVEFLPLAEQTVAAMAARLAEDASSLERMVRPMRAGALADGLRRDAAALVKEIAGLRGSAGAAPSLAALRGVEKLLGQAETSAESLRSRAARAALAADGAPYALTVESSMTKVRPDRPYAGKPGTRLSLCGARDEVVGAQVVVVPVTQGLSGVRVEASGLKGPGGAAIPASAVSIRRVGSVAVAEPSGGAQGGPGAYPDPLLPLEPFDVEQAAVQPLWLNVRVPEGARAGHYEGTITVTPANVPARKLPLSLRVFDFTLPRTSKLRTVFQIMPGYVAQRHKLAQSRDEIPGWDKGLWSGADVRGIADYFGKGVFRMERDTEVKHSGACSARITGVEIRKGQEPPRAAFTVKVALKPDTDYTLSLWYLTRDLREEHPDADLWNAAHVALPPSPEWKRVQADFHTKPDMKETYLYLRSHGLGDVWFDDVSLKEKGNDTEILPNPGFEDVPGATVAEMLRRYRLNSLEHRASDMNVAAPKITVEGNRVSMEWDDFDREIAEYLALGQNAFNIHWCRLPTGWGDVEKVSPEQLRVAEELLRQTEKHLADKGWLDYGYLYVIDEPGAKAFPDVKAAFSLAKRVAPRLKTLLTFGYGATRPWRSGQAGPPAYADLAGVIDIWVPHIDCFDPEFLDTRRQKGEEIWHYVCISAQRPYPNMWGIDYPGIDHRIVFWQLWRYRITGFLYWATTYWVKDVWQDPLSYPGGNGDGSLLYPSADGPVDSVRWEIIRDGIRDYDYLSLLAEKAGKRRNEPAIRKLLDVSDLTPSFTEYTKDPQALERRREQIGEWIERLSRE